MIPGDPTLREPVPADAAPPARFYPVAFLLASGVRFGWTLRDAGDYALAWGPDARDSIAEVEDDVARLRRALDDGDVELRPRRRTDDWWWCLFDLDGRCLVVSDGAGVRVGGVLRGAERTLALMAHAPLSRSLRVDTGGPLSDAAPGATYAREVGSPRLDDAAFPDGGARRLVGGQVAR